MLPIFFLLGFCSHAIGLQALEEYALPDQTRAGCLFNLIRKPRGYQYIGTSSFPDPFHFTKSHTNPNTIVIERLRHYPQNFGVGHAFFLIFHPRNSKLKKKLEASIGLCNFMGEFFDRITSFAVYPSTIWNQLDECLSYSHISHRFTQKQKPPQKIFPIPRKPQILKNFFRINIIPNISKPSIKSSFNGFRQIS